MPTPQEVMKYSQAQLDALLFSKYKHLALHSPLITAEEASDLLRDSQEARDIISQFPAYINKAIDDYTFSKVYRTLMVNMHDKKFASIVDDAVLDFYKKSRLLSANVKYDINSLNPYIRRLALVSSDRSKVNKNVVLKILKQHDESVQLPFSKHFDDAFKRLSDSDIANLANEAKTPELLVRVTREGKDRINSYVSAFPVGAFLPRVSNDIKIFLRSNSILKNTAAKALLGDVGPGSAGRPISAHDLTYLQFIDGLPKETKDIIANRLYTEVPNETIRDRALFEVREAQDLYPGLNIEKINSRIATLLPFSNELMNLVRNTEEPGMQHFKLADPATTPDEAYSILLNNKYVSQNYLPHYNDKVSQIDKQKQKDLIGLNKTLDGYLVNNLQDEIEKDLEFAKKVAYNSKENSAAALRNPNLDTDHLRHILSSGEPIDSKLLENHLSKLTDSDIQYLTTKNDNLGEAFAKRVEDIASKPENLEFARKILRSTSKYSELGLLNPNIESEDIVDHFYHNPDSIKDNASKILPKLKVEDFYALNKLNENAFPLDLVYGNTLSHHDFIKLPKESGVEAFHPGKLKSNGVKSPSFDIKGINHDPQKTAEEHLNTEGEKPYLDVIHSLYHFFEPRESHQKPKTFDFSENYKESVVPSNFLGFTVPLQQKIWAKKGVIGNFLHFFDAYKKDPKGAAITKMGGFLKGLHVLLHEGIHSYGNMPSISGVPGNVSDSITGFEEAATEILSTHHLTGAAMHVSPLSYSELKTFGFVNKPMFSVTKSKDIASSTASYKVYCSNFAKLAAIADGQHNINSIGVKGFLTRHSSVLNHLLTKSAVKWAHAIKSSEGTLEDRLRPMAESILRNKGIDKSHPKYDVIHKSLTQELIDSPVHGSIISNEKLTHKDINNTIDSVIKTHDSAYDPAKIGTPKPIPPKPVPTTKIAKSEMEVLSKTIPFSTYTHVKHNTHKLRKIRDIIQSTGKSDLHYKNLPPGDYSMFQDKDGNVDATKIQRYIDSAPEKKYNLGHTRMMSPDRHTSGPSQVLQIKLTPELYEEIAKQNLLDVFNYFNKLAQNSGAPVSKDNSTIGWVRYTGGKNGIQIDEIRTMIHPVQKKYSSYFEREADSYGLQAEDRQKFVNKANQAILENAPDDRVKKLIYILFNGRHPSELMHDVFLQFLRDLGWTDTPVHIHHLKTKSHLSLDPTKPIIEHLKETYQDFPEKFGYERGGYGEIKTQSNPLLRGKDQLKEQVRKSEMEGKVVEQKSKVESVTNPKLAEEIQEAFNEDQVREAKIKGKYSKNAKIAKCKSGKWLLKPGLTGFSPAKGMNESKVPQTRREYAFSKVAELVGMQEFYPKCEIVKIDGVEVAAIEFLTNGYVSFDKMKGSEIPIVRAHESNGDIYRWAVLDYLLGNTDRHSGNILASTGSVKLIDHGSAFAGFSFDPGNDKNSFIPYYLRCFADKKEFAYAEPKERYKMMPKPSSYMARDIGVWINSIDRNKLELILIESGIDFEPVVARLDYLQSFGVDHKIFWVLHFLSGDLTE